MCKYESWCYSEYFNEDLNTKYCAMSMKNLKKQNFNENVI